MQLPLVTSASPERCVDDCNPNLYLRRLAIMSRRLTFAVMMRATGACASRCRVHVVSVLSTCIMKWRRVLGSAAAGSRTRAFSAKERRRLGIDAPRCGEVETPADAPRGSTARETYHATAPPQHTHTRTQPAALCACRRRVSPVRVPLTLRVRQSVGSRRRRSVRLLPRPCATRATCASAQQTRYSSLCLRTHGRR
jgi:hypothetical protein